MSKSRGPRESGRELTRIGAVLPDIRRNFRAGHALGLILIDASALAQIEGVYGGEAYEGAMNNLGVVVSDLLGEKLGIDDLVLGGETGRNEVVVLLFRDANEEQGFYTKEMPELCRALQIGLLKRGGRVGYPHLRKAPPLPIGSAASLRNPTIGAETQVRAALVEARADVDLNKRIGQRERRRELFDLVLMGQVRSVYEPIVDVATRTVFGYEALARGPEGSPLHSPLALFETATEVDLLFQLDCLCRESGLDGARGLPGGTKLFLNVRPTTIHDPNFREDALSRTLERCGLQPSDVVFEISEQESIGNFAIFREVRDAYRKLGFQFALDDTGAGYASLESVLELSPEFIKVDRAFVSGIDEDPGRQQLLRAMHSIAEQTGSRIIGEGLDTLEELETLGTLGIPFGQGWLFGKPHPLRTDT